MKKGFLLIIAVFMIVWSILVIVVEPNTVINSFIAVTGIAVGIFSIYIGTQID